MLSPSWVAKRVIGKYFQRAVNQASVGPNINLSCGSGNVRNKFCDAEKVPRQYLLGCGINNNTKTRKNELHITSGGGDGKSASYLLSGFFKLAALLEYIQLAL